MGVPLGRAWEICRILDEADAQSCAHELDRAITLTASTSGTGKTGRAGLARGAPMPVVNPEDVERQRRQRRRRLGLGA